MSGLALGTTATVGVGVPARESAGGSTLRNASTGGAVLGLRREFVRTVD